MLLAAGTGTRLRVSGFTLGAASTHRWARFAAQRRWSF